MPIYSQQIALKEAHISLKTTAGLRFFQKSSEQSQGLIIKNFDEKFPTHFVYTCEVATPLLTLLVCTTLVHL